MWMVALALTGICMGQQTPEEKKFYEDQKKSELQTIAAYPDAGKTDSPLTLKMQEIEAALKTLGDPRYNSADKPMILAQMAAKELGIKPAISAQIDKPKADEHTNIRPPSAMFEDEVIPEFLSYKSVRVRKVEPDGLTIIHESGSAKIPVERLTEDQRTRYGITVEGAAQYRKQLAENSAANQAREQELARNQPPETPPSAAAPTAKFITATQVKAVWVKKLPQPRTLDPNYSKIIASYREFVGEIRAGKRDLDAQETAATYNKAKAIDIGNNELAATYEAELDRISEAQSAAELLAQQARQARTDNANFMMLNSQLDSIDRNLRDINNTMQSR